MKELLDRDLLQWAMARLNRERGNPVLLLDQQRRERQPGGEQADMILSTGPVEPGWFGGEI